MVVHDTQQPLRYAITNLCGAGSDFARTRRLRLQEQVRRWASEGVDFIQLREKQLGSGELLDLAETALEMLHDLSGQRRIRFLVNGRPDVAVAARACGVHFTARPGECTPAQARRVFEVAGLAEPYVSRSCHSVSEVVAARRAGTDLILFGPVFEKRVDGQVVASGLGLRELSEAREMAQLVPVLALGGVTPENAAACLEAGADGFAGIRIFDTGPV